MEVTTVSTELERSGILRDPRVAELFKQSEGRHFTDDELTIFEREFPERAPHAAAAREVRTKDLAAIQRVVKEIFSQYNYEKNHEFAMAKCPRDIRYVVAYGVHAMLADDHQWYDDKVLIWLKTILQSFDFPERNRTAMGALFADKALEARLKELPQKTKSTYHTYYRIKAEMKKELSPAAFELMAPFFQQAIDTLTEAY
jgi:hypothetical protein